MTLILLDIRNVIYKDDLLYLTSKYVDEKGKYLLAGTHPGYLYGQQ